MFVAYLITNIVNGKSYVGVTAKSLRSRWLRHCSDAKCGSQLLFHRAIRKYGKESFLITAIAMARSWPDIILVEPKLIVDFATRSPHGYNSTDGGDGVVGYVPSEWHKERVGAANRGRKLTDEHREKLREALRKRVYTPQMRANKSAARHRLIDSGWKSIGRPKGLRHTADTVAKISANRKGKGLNNRAAAKLTFEQALEIRRRAIAGEHKQKIAAAFGITPNYVDTIRRGDRWRVE